MRKKPELLAPAGDMEKLRMAVLYGADAVYLAGTSFGMRSFAGNFTADELEDIMEQNRQQLNAQLPAYSRITAIELRDEEFAKTPKKSIKRYLYS